MRLAVVACFLNEERYLPTFLTSLSAQSRPPDRLLLVDDGSNDGSVALANQFAAEHPYARVLCRPRRPPERDRLAAAPELAAFSWAVEQLDLDWNVVAKLDADLKLSADCFEELERRLIADAGLGLVGAYQSIVAPDGKIVREDGGPPDHVRGSTKFYRRECFEQVYPLPLRIGWDTSDETIARMHGWRTASFAMPLGDPLHMRPTATYDGALRGSRRAGVASYAYGAELGWVLVGTARRLPSTPRVLGGLNYLLGWITAALRRDPRVEAPQRAFMRAEHRRRVRSALAQRAGRTRRTSP
jgi:biofilm PGA synthesis N-glycosyltransferase PgaC